MFSTSTPLRVQTVALVMPGRLPVIRIWSGGKAATSAISVEPTLTRAMSELARTNLLPAIGTATSLVCGASFWARARPGTAMVNAASATRSLVCIVHLDATGGGRGRRTVGAVVS